MSTGQVREEVDDGGGDQPSVRQRDHVAACVERDKAAGVSTFAGDRGSPALRTDPVVAAADDEDGGRGVGERVLDGIGARAASMEPSMARNVVRLYCRRRPGT